MIPLSLYLVGTYPGNSALRSFQYDDYSQSTASVCFWVSDTNIQRLGWKSKSRIHEPGNLNTQWDSNEESWQGLLANGQWRSKTRQQADAEVPSKIESTGAAERQQINKASKVEKYRAMEHAPEIEG